MAKIDITKTEVVWPGKYDENGQQREVERVKLPFQVIETINESRASREAAQKPKQASLFDIWEAKEGDTFEEGWKNKLIWGENKLVMGSLLDKFAGKINLIYIDPPFATGADFNFSTQIGETDIEVLKEQSIIEEKAYRDTWGKGLNSYLQMMRERLMLMKDLLSNTGSIYIHLDWRVVHHVRLILAEIFGEENFQREIIWWPNNPSGFKGIAKNWIRDHETLLFTTKSSDFVFNKIYQEYTDAYIKATFVHDDGDGRLYRWRYDRKQYFDESKGVPASDVWDIPYLR